MTASVVLSPVPPDDLNAWYAPAVRTQYELARGVTATVYERGGEPAFRYEIGEPTVPASNRETLAEPRSFFADANHQPPLTREATAERFAAGFPEKWRRAFDRVADHTGPTCRGGQARVPPETPLRRVRRPRGRRLQGAVRFSRRPQDRRDDDRHARRPPRGRVRGGVRTTTRADGAHLSPWHRNTVA